MQDEISVAEFQTTKCHGHPTFDICGQEDKRPVLYYHFQVRVQELEDQIEIRL